MSRSATNTIWPTRPALGSQEWLTQSAAPSFGVTRYRSSSIWTERRCLSSDIRPSISPVRTSPPQTRSISPARTRSRAKSPRPPLLGIRRPSSFEEMCPVGWTAMLRGDICFFLRALFARTSCANFKPARAMRASATKYRVKTWRSAALEHRRGGERSGSAGDAATGMRAGAAQEEIRHRRGVAHGLDGGPDHELVERVLGVVHVAAGDAVAGRD